MRNSPDKKDKSTTLSRIMAKFRHGLVLQSIKNQLYKIGIEITPYYWVQEGINPTDIPEIKGSASEYSIEFLDAADLKSIGDNIRGYNTDTLLSDLNAGHLCLGLKTGNNIASFLWMNLKEVSFAPINMPLKSDEVYLTSMYTMESFRGINLAPYLRYHSYQVLKNMGRDKIYSVSEYFNSSAIRYKEKLNAKNIKLVLYIELFKKIKWNIILKKY